MHSGPNVLVVNPATPFKTVKEVVAYAKANPGKLDYGYTHAASGHMAMELFKQTAGMFMTGIPYRGGGPMLTDLLGGTDSHDVHQPGCGTAACQGRQDCVRWP